MKVSRTIADLDNLEDIRIEHLAEVLQEFGPAGLGWIG
ncbi:Mg(2+) chelatase family protein [Arcticibacter svalbardensis MN12-7]|uniref:Mg(2+) chelatase family protein n=1 Tax=Arcticibacter svalbardensis MN12-7 TaxID=1150600 RepID=R9GT83_9SPHI|nr:Mg(2+) chelatase family protein [Arcticibacter svalbardensis MN12-7]